MVFNMVVLTFRINENDFQKWFSEKIAILSLLTADWRIAVLFLVNISNCLQKINLEMQEFWYSV